MEVKENFKVGETAYLLKISNYRKEAPLESRIMEVKVLKVGRKHITVDLWRGTKFDSTNDFRQVTPCSPDYQLYSSKEQILLDLQREKMKNDIRSSFSLYNSIWEKISFEDLQTVHEIINKY